MFGQLMSCRLPHNFQYRLEHSGRHVNYPPPGGEGPGTGSADSQVQHIRHPRGPGVGCKLESAALADTEETAQTPRVRAQARRRQ